MAISCWLVWGQSFSLHHQQSRKGFRLPHEVLPLNVPMQVSSKAQNTLQKNDIEWNPRTFTWENVYLSVSQKPLWLFSFFFNLFFNFTILYWCCHISKWIHHRYTCVPHPEPSSLLPPHTIPLGRLSAPAPSIQYRALNLDWRLVSYMIVSCFNAILPNHPTLSLSHRVHKTVLYISVSFAVSYTG